MSENDDSPVIGVDPKNPFGAMGQQPDDVEEKETEETISDEPGVDPKLDSVVAESIHGKTSESDDEHDVEDTSDGRPEDRSQYHEKVLDEVIGDTSDSDEVSCGEEQQDDVEQDDVPVEPPCPAPHPSSKVDELFPKQHIPAFEGSKPNADATSGDTSSDSSGSTTSCSEDKKSLEEKQYDLLYPFMQRELYIFESDTGEIMVQHREGGVKKVEDAISANLQQIVCAKAFEHEQVETLESVEKRIAKNLLRDHRINSKKEDTYVRFAQKGSDFYLDLANDRNEVVKINRKGWVITDQCDIAFIKYPHMKSLPNPVGGGNFQDLFQDVHLGKPQELPLLVTWLFLALFIKIPRYVLLLSGRMGSAKTTVAMMLKRLLDDSQHEVGLFPEEVSSAVAVLSTHGIIAYDNARKFSEDQEQFICMTATGGGKQVRKFYTNKGTVGFKLLKSTIFTAITNPFRQPDTLNRVLEIKLAPIDSFLRLESKVIWDKFNKNHSYYLGAFLDTFVKMLNVLDNTNLTIKPRMADAAKIQVAAAHVMGFDVDEVERQFTLNEFTTQTASAVNDKQLELFFEYLDSNNGIHGKSFTDVRQELVNLAVKKNQSVNQCVPGSAGSLSRKFKTWEPVIDMLGWQIHLTMKDGYNLLHVSKKKV